MASLEELTERIDRLALRHEELRRTNRLLEDELAAVASERDSLRSRLSAARNRIETLLSRLPDGPAAPSSADALSAGLALADVPPDASEGATR